MSTLFLLHLRILGRYIVMTLAFAPVPSLVCGFLTSGADVEEAASSFLGATAT